MQLDAQTERFYDANTHVDVRLAYERYADASYLLEKDDTPTCEQLLGAFEEVASRLHRCPCCNQLLERRQQAREGVGSTAYNCDACGKPSAGERLLCRRRGATDCDFDVCRRCTVKFVLRADLSIEEATRLSDVIVSLTAGLQAEIQRRQKVLKLYAESIRSIWGPDRARWPGVAAATLGQPVQLRGSQASTTLRVGTVVGRAAKASSIAPQGVIRGWSLGSKEWGAVRSTRSTQSETAGGVACPMVACGDLSGNAAALCVQWFRGADAGRFTTIKPEDPPVFFITDGRTPPEKRALQVGDIVRVREGVKPKHGWGSVTFSSIGTITISRPDGLGYTVNFPEQSSWSAGSDDLERVGGDAASSSCAWTIGDPIDQFAYAEDAAEQQMLLSVLKLHNLLDAAFERLQHWQNVWHNVERCCLCFDYVPEMYRGCVSHAECGHAASVCLSCLGGYFKSAIDNGGVCERGIRCLEHGCTSYFDASAIRSACPKEYAAKYERRVRNAIISADPHRRWCPSASCESVIDVGLTDTCPTCTKRICISCGADWHGSKACEEAMDSSLLELAQKLGWKTCPHCGKMVERTEGCNTMQCHHLGCQQKFCYACAKEPCACSK